MAAQAGGDLEYGRHLLALDRAEEALGVFAAVAEQARREHGGVHPRTLEARADVVDALIAAGRLAEGEAEARALVHAYGAKAYADAGFAMPRHRSHMQLAKVLSQAGRVREAIDVSEAVLPAAARELGTDHPYVLVSRVNRAQHLALLGRFAQAQAEGTALAAIAASLAERGDPNAAVVRLAVANGLAFSYAECGMPVEAERWARGSLAEAEQLLGGHSDFAQGLRLNLLTGLVGQGRHEEALAEAEWLPAFSAAQPGSRSLVRAEALYGLGRLADAEAEALRALEEAGPRLAPIHHRILRTRTLLALVHGSPHEMHAVASAWTEHFGPDHPRARAAWAAVRLG
ncbi:tetratricopeptide repeat protein [Streptomyces sp. HPF1205]|uniref:tetratricopeptide repeat protein n=1 Tax=Streptomyces sp. HPF1205 TaxID=2873262 RepID=UPI001CEC18CA|nr:tetratricopeptide repeat protein [Streptomyces sp. HPF1205]